MTLQMAIITYDILGLWFDIVTHFNYLLLTTFLTIYKGWFWRKFNTPNSSPKIWDTLKVMQVLSFGSHTCESVFSFSHIHSKSWSLDPLGNIFLSQKKNIFSRPKSWFHTQVRVMTSLLEDFWITFEVGCFFPSMLLNSRKISRCIPLIIYCCKNVWLNIWLAFGYLAFLTHPKYYRKTWFFSQNRWWSLVTHVK